MGLLTCRKLSRAGADAWTSPADSCLVVSGPLHHNQAASTSTAECMGKKEPYPSQNAPPSCLTPHSQSTRRRVTCATSSLDVKRKQRPVGIVFIWVDTWPHQVKNLQPEEESPEQTEFMDWHFSENQVKVLQTQTTLTFKSPQLPW